MQSTPQPSKMAEGSRDDDPFSWGTERVVTELCTANRTWTPTPRAKFPDPDAMAERLRDCDYDGDTLLSCKEKELWKDLGITKTKFKVAIRSAISQFKARSQEYKKHMKRVKRTDGDSESDDDNNRPDQNQSEAHHQAFTPVSDIGGSGNAQSNELDQSGSDAMQLDQDSVNAPSKKRRLAPTALMTTERTALQGQLLNKAKVPTEADNMSFLPTETGNIPPAEEPGDLLSSLKQASLVHPDEGFIPTEAPTEPTEDYEENCKSKPGAYWGNGKLPKLDIINRLTTVDADPMTDFGWGRPKPFGKARKQYISRVLQNHLLYPEKRTAPQEDDILPAYGESDDEDDPEWDEVDREIQDEEDEIRLEQEEILVLKPEEVDALLKKMVEECATTWHETRLPKEKHKAYAMWTEVRKHGTRRSEMQVLSTELRTAEQGLEKILNGLKDNQYTSEAELRGMSPLLEPCVQPIEHIKWLIHMISSPNAPEKVVRPKTQVQREPKPRPAQDSIDIWSEDELEDQMHDFIVDDDAPSDSDDSLSESDALAGDAYDHPMGTMNTDLPASDLPVGPNQSFTSSIDEDVEMHDLTSIDDALPHDSDLTDMVISPKQKSASKALKTNPAPSNPEEPPLSDVKAIANKGSCYWESKGDAKRLIINLLHNQSPMMRRSVLNVVSLTDVDECWEDYIEYGCENWELTFDKTTPREKVRHDTALLLIRLFNVFVQECCTPPSAVICKDFNRTLSWASKNKQHFEPFWGFLKLVSGYFEISRNAVAKRDSSKNVQSPVKPATKRKHDEAEIEEEEQGDDSQRFRERDGRRQQEQQARRLHLREQVEGSKISREQSRLIINESKLDGQNLVYVHPHIAPLIKDHQIDGVRFMWDQLLSESDQGCLLAHTMGLGKTMQVITLLTAIQEAATSHDPKVSCQIPDHLKESRTLILCPAGLINNWMDELLYWAPEGLLGELFAFDATLSEQERAETIQDWAQDGGVLIIGYTMLTSVAKHEELLRLLLDKPTIVVGDEAHQLKNKNAKRSEIASRFRTHSRLALTGSPLSNSVGEYYAMIHWVAPDFLGDWTWFNAEYAVPIADGLYSDSSIADRRNAKIRLAALRKIVAPKVHRRSVGTLKDSLPPKKEYIIHLDISSVQKEVYLAYLQGVKGTDQDVTSRVTSLWSLIHTLNILLAHPMLLETKLLDVQKTRREFKAVKKVNEENGDGSVEVLPLQVVSATLRTLISQEGYRELTASFKMLALVKILDEAAKLGENVLVFSRSIATLDFIQDICKTQQKPYKRLDGSTKPASRQSQVKDFNQGKGQVYLISTTAGGVGLNIYGASRVVIFDFEFNPSTEQQAIGRSYRIGQTKPVVVYWLICDGTFEKTMHNQQIFKNQLASRVVDKKDLLPKARQLKEYFMEPQQMDHQDTSAYRGQDIILDALLGSDEVNEGISSISTTETFEEEDTQQLPDEDQRAAEAMARQTAQKSSTADEQGHYYHPMQYYPEGFPPSSTPSIPISSGFVHPQTSSLAAIAENPQSWEKGFDLLQQNSVPQQELSAAPLQVANSPFANPATQALPTELSAHSPSPQIPTRGQLPAAHLAGSEVPNKSAAAAYGSVNLPLNSCPSHRAAFWNYHATNSAMRRPATPAVAYNVELWANNEQSSVQSPSLDSTPHPMSIDATHQHVQTGAPMTPDGAQGMSPAGPSTTQMGHDRTTANSGNTLTREDNAPMALATTSRRDDLATSGDEMTAFKGILEKQAPPDLRHLVPTIVTRLLQQFTGGLLQRNVAWHTLQAAVKGRPDRASVILREDAQPQRVAEVAKNGVNALGTLLDAARLSQGSRNSRDPDVRAPFPQYDF